MARRAAPNLKIFAPWWLTPVVASAPSTPRAPPVAQRPVKRPCVTRRPLRLIPVAHRPVTKNLCVHLRHLRLTLVAPRNIFINFCKPRRRHMPLTLVIQAGLPAMQGGWQVNRRRGQYNPITGSIFMNSGTSRRRYLALLALCGPAAWLNTRDTGVLAQAFQQGG